MVAQWCLNIQFGLTSGENGGEVLAPKLHISRRRYYLDKTTCLFFYVYKVGPAIIEKFPKMSRKPHVNVCL